MFQALSCSTFPAVQNHIGHRDKFVYGCKSTRNCISVSGVFDCTKKCILCICPVDDLAVRICADIFKMIIYTILYVTGCCGHILRNWEIYCQSCNEFLNSNPFLSFILYLSSITFCKYKKSARILWPQERKTSSKIRNSIFVSCALTVVNKTSICFNIILPLNFYPFFLVCSFNARFIKENGD